MRGEPQVLAEGLSKQYGGVVVVDRVDLRIGAGEAVGLLGPNGAGKTTLVQLVTGLRRATAGRVQLFGRTPTDPAARVALGTVPQQTSLPATLRVAEVVAFVGRHFPAPVPVGELLDRFGLSGLGRRQTGGLSGGQQRRLAVALAFVGCPRLVLLDEPTTGLDVGARHVLWDAVRAYRAEGGTVVLTSHHLEEVEALADRVVVMHRGRVLADGGVAAMRGQVPSRRVRLQAPALPDLAGVTRVQVEGDRHELWTTDSDAVVRQIVAAGVPFTDLEVIGASLEEAFLALTSDRVPAGGAAR